MCYTMGRAWGLMGWGDSTTLDNLYLTTAARGLFSDLIPFWLTHPMDCEYTIQWITGKTSMHNVAKTWKPKSCTEYRLWKILWNNSKNGNTASYICWLCARKFKPERAYNNLSNAYIPDIQRLVGNCNPQLQTCFKKKKVTITGQRHKWSSLSPYNTCLKKY